MINRRRTPTSRTTRRTSSALEDAGAVVLSAATARIVGRGHGRGPPRRRRRTTRRRRNVVIAVGSTSKVPPLPGLDDVADWTNREATLARELPQSLLVLGGGPTGCELAQVYARFGVPTTIVQSGRRG